MDRYPALIVALAVLGSWPQSSTQAGTVVSNLTQPLDGHVFVRDAQWRAVSFTVGPTAHVLDRVNLDAGVDRYSWDGNGFGVSIYADAPGYPTTPLETLTGLAPSTTTGDIYAYNSSGLSLAANQTYWVVASGTASTDVRWVTTTSTSESPALPGFAIGNLTWMSLNHGGSWGNTNVVTRFSVDATPVPEASTIGLAVFGLMGLACRGRRRSV